MLNAKDNYLFKTIIKIIMSPVKKPSGLSRASGRHSDGMTSRPWCSGKFVVWDVRIVNTMVECVITESGRRR